MKGPRTIAEIARRVDAAVPDAVPPPRFEDATFETYRPAHPSQDLACAAVSELARDLRDRPVGPFARLRRKRSGRGLYLDGGYGVGKTHLLAAAFHAAPVSRKCYLTFQELVYLIGAQGMESALDLFGESSLLCIDEFELDDPGNTLLVKRFLEGVFAGGAAVVTTSNTPPEAQGSGRFNADDFRREIQGIARNFETVTLEGGDFRRREAPVDLVPPARLEAELAHAGGGPVTAGTFDELLAVLRELHPIRYRGLIERLGTLYLRGVHTIGLQTDALRFVHFIDQLYDRRAGLRASGEVPLSGLFDSSYRHGAYARKHERCISRLGELLAESAPVGSTGSGALPRAEGQD